MEEVGSLLWFKITCVDVRGALGVVGMVVGSVVGWWLDSRVII